MAVIEYNIFLREKIIIWHCSRNDRQRKKIDLYYSEKNQEQKKPGVSSFHDTFYPINGNLRGILSLLDYVSQRDRVIVITRLLCRIQLHLKIEV